MSRAAVGLIAAWACLTVAIPVAAQGLGDAAKKEKELRESSAPTARSYSEEDLEKMPPNAYEEDARKTPPPAATSSRSAVQSQTPQREPDRRDEEDQWRARVAQARGRIDEARARHEHAASLTLVPGYALVDENNRIVASSVEELQENTARAKSRLEAAEKALEDLLEEARRQGVPPGWLR